MKTSPPGPGRTSPRIASRGFLTLALAGCLAWGGASAALAAQSRTAQSAAGGQVMGRTPSDVVRDFYRLMRERRFREAFALSVFGPAVEGLSAQEFEDLRPDFERQSLEVPEKVVLTGEQLSGNNATVFLKLGTDDAPQVVPVFLIRERGVWIIGDREGQKLVRKQGKKYFFEARMDAHHDDVENMLKRISTAQLIYSSQHAGQFADLQQLVQAGLVPADILTTASTGYRFRVAPTADGKSYAAGAEPARYGVTGRLSFYIDPQSGLRKEDKGGRPLK
jgi:hypothetical protein